MKKGLRLFFLLILLAIPLSIKSVFAANIPDPEGPIYVQDFAQLLSEKDKQEIIQLGSFLDERTGAQIALLTVPSLEGVPVQDYAVEAFRQYGLGDAEKNNGVLILLALEERKIYISVGYGLEGRLPDGKVGRILDTYALPYLENNDFSSGLTNTYKQLFNEVAEEYQLGEQVETQSFEYGYENKEISPFSIIIFTIIFLIILFLDFKFFGGAFSYTLFRILAFALRSGGGGSGGGRGGGSSRGGGGSTGGGGAGRSF